MLNFSGLTKGMLNLIGQGFLDMFMLGEGGGGIFIFNFTFDLRFLYKRIKNNWFPFSVLCPKF